MAAHANEEKICCTLCFLDARHAKRLKVCLAYKRMEAVGRGRAARGVSGITTGQRTAQCGPVGVSRPLTSVKLIENRNSAATRRAIPFHFRHTHTQHGRGGVMEGCLGVYVCKLCDLTIASLADLFLASPRQTQN